MFSNNTTPQTGSVNSTLEVEIPTRTCDEKRIEKLKFKYNNMKEILSNKEEQLQNVRQRSELYYQEQVKAEEELELAQIKYKNIKNETSKVYRELRNTEKIVRKNKNQKNEALHRYNSAIKEKSMKIQMKLFNTTQDLNRLERSNDGVSLNLELLRSKIPDEVLNTIASYLNYNTRIEMIEHFHKPQNYLQCLSAARLKTLLHNMNYASYYCLTRILASSKETNLLRSNYNNNTSIYETLRKEESIVKIKFILMIFKKKDPECALRILKIFAILNQSNVANKCKHTNTMFALSLKQDMEFFTDHS